MKINYIDLTVKKNEYKKAIAPLLESIFFKGSYVGGEDIDNFEKKFAKFCGTKYAISVNSGTDALILALKAYGIGLNDEVITVSNSFIATANAISLVGAKPVFVDIGDDLLIDSSKIKKAINKKTKAIMPVHLMGLICDMDEINKIAKKYNLIVIEDAAQSSGSTYKNKKSGNLGTIGCFSLHPLKNLGGIGDGGIITTNSKRISKKLKMLRNNGLKDRDNQEIVGTVSRLDSINAVVLNKRLEGIDTVLQNRIHKASIYKQELKKINKVNYINYSKDKVHTYHTFIIIVKKRDKLQEFLHLNGIETKIHYPKLIHKNKTYKNEKYELPKSEYFNKHILTLPIANVTENEIIYICEKIKEFYEG